MPDTVVTTTMSTMFAPSFSEKLILLYIDLWKPYPFGGSGAGGDFGYYPALRAEIENTIANRLKTLLRDEPSLGTRPWYFAIAIEANLLDVPLIPGSQPGHLKAYFESQLYFILAKYSFMKNRNLYSKDQLQKDISDFCDAAFDSTVGTFLYSIDWFNQYKTNKTTFISAADIFVRTNYSTVVTLLNTHNNFDGVDDIFMLLSVKGDNSLRRIFGANLADSSDDALMFDADAIINDNQFSVASKKSFPSYVVLNTLKRVNRVNINSFYNFYASNESIVDMGDKIANSTNYYDLAAAYKFMPRYNKLTWGPIQGGSGISMAIVPISGNISNISELQILNEYYVSQTFRKQGSGNDYVTACSSSENKFETSPFWAKILDGLKKSETKDLIDNKIFIVDHELLRKRSDEQPRLQYVGYIIHKYEFRDTQWKLKEVIMLDDCSTSTYYDFNVLYDRKYKYKIATLLKWVYSTSLTEVESFYTGLPSVLVAPPVSPEVMVLGPTIARPLVETMIAPGATGVRDSGIRIMGSAERYVGRSELIAGETARATEIARTDSGDTTTTTVQIAAMNIAQSLGIRSRMGR
jgi:hypothetical protein